MKISLTKRELLAALSAFSDEQEVIISVCGQGSPIRWVGEMRTIYSSEEIDCGTIPPSIVLRDKEPK